jgi:hypothetical protein
VVNRYLWAGVALVALAYLLMAFVKEFLPFFIVTAVLLGIYSVMFRKRW